MIYVLPKNISIKIWNNLLDLYTYKINHTWVPILNNMTTPAVYIDAGTEFQFFDREENHSTNDMLAGASDEYLLFTTPNPP